MQETQVGWAASVWRETKLAFMKWEQIEICNTFCRAEKEERRKEENLVGWKAGELKQQICKIKGVVQGNNQSVWWRYEWEKQNSPLKILGSNQLTRISCEVINKCFYFRFPEMWSQTDLFCCFTCPSLPRFTCTYIIGYVITFTFPFSQAIFYCSVPFPYGISNPVLIPNFSYLLMKGHRQNALDLFLAPPMLLVHEHFQSFISFFI